MNENTGSARGFWDSLYERHGRILAPRQYDVSTEVAASFTNI